MIRWRMEKGVLMGKVSNEEKKEFLWGYRDSIQRIERIRAEIEELRAMKIGVSAGGGGGGRKGWKGDLSGYAARLDELEREKEQEQCVRIKSYEQVEDAINSLDDAREQDVLFYRYIKGMKWWEIADKMQRSERWVLKLHGVALGHINI